jgi:hypothetical protein
VSENPPPNAHAPPDAREAVGVVATLAAWARIRSRAYVLLASGTGALVLTISAATVLRGEPLKIVTILGGGLATLCFALAVLHALVALFRGKAAIPGWESVLLVLVPLLGGSALTLVGFVLTVWATNGFARGRQLRRFGRVLLPPVRSGGDWASEGRTIDVPSGVRHALAERWRWNGRTEHASVAAFARLTLDLMALGAPPELVHAANRDASDETRHAELCFALARAIDGRSESPGPFPEAQRARTLSRNRTLALAQLAVDSLVDGALHEGLSARVIAKLARRCEEPRIGSALRELAADEGRHAAHGWDVVEWCLAEGGRPVAEALRGALAALPRRVHSDLPEQARSGAWEPYGIHGALLESEEHARARADIIRRVGGLLDRRGDSAAPPDSTRRSESAREGRAA